VPSGREHRKITAEFLGWDIPGVHALMDAFAQIVPGGAHRAVGHDLKMLRFIESEYGKPGKTIWAMHILEDARIITRRK